MDEKKGEFEAMAKRWIWNSNFSRGGKTKKMMGKEGGQTDEKESTTKIQQFWWENGEKKELVLEQ